MTPTQPAYFGNRHVVPAPPDALKTVEAFGLAEHGGRFNALAVGHQIGLHRRVVQRLAFLADELGQ